MATDDEYRNPVSVDAARQAARGLIQLRQIWLPGHTELDEELERQVAETRGGSWSCPSRPRRGRTPTGRKTRWARAL